jgi:hypothetical protein
MIEPMHADINDEVARFVSLVLKTFDPTRYPHLEDGPEFDAALQRVEAAFAALRQTFQDCLVAGWSSEAATAVRRAADRQAVAKEPHGTSR